MEEHNRLPRAVVTTTISVLAVPLMYFISRYSYNLFHSLADGLTIVVAASAFVVIWNSRRNVDNHYFTYLGISLLFFAFLDLIHMLGNKDMAVFPGYGNLGPTFYIASRYVLSASLLISPLFINRRLNTSAMFAGYSLATLLILLSVFYWNVFPACIVEGVGLTRFKVVSDYIICLILLGGAGLLFVNRRSFDSRVLRILVFSIALSVATGLTFALYTDPFGVTNMVGHLFQIASFYLIYVAIIETSITKPQEILFRTLKQNEEKLTENVLQLDHANAELQQKIAERRQAEEALRESEQRWATTLASIGDAVIATDVDGRVTFMNPVAETLTGWRTDNAVTRPVSDVFTILNEHTRSTVDCPVTKVLREGNIVGLANHTILVRKDGTEVPIDDSGSPIRDLDGNVVGVVLVFRDITKRMQTEKELKKSVERLDIISGTASQLLMSRDPQAIVDVLCQNVMKHLDCHAFFNFLVDDERNCLRLNAYAGISEEAAREIYFLDYGVAVCGCAARDACRIVAENIPTTLDVRTELVRSFGITAYAAHPLFSQGQVIGTLSFGTKSRLTFTDDDLSLMTTVADQVAMAMERVRLLKAAEWRAEEMERRVRERTDELRQAYDRLIQETRERERVESQLRQSQKMEALGTLTGGIAHDFNNILAAVIGFAELARDRIPADSKPQRHLARVLEAGIRGRDLVRHMLTFSRRTEQEKEALPLSNIVKETLKLLRASIPSTINIKTDVESDSSYVFADSVQIQQVVMNLCTNAAHAMRERGGLLHIELSDFSVSPREKNIHDIPPGLYVRLSVRDTGTGMSRETLRRIFDPFFTTKKTGEGTGLGLSVVHGIVSQHEGYVTVESDLEKGSTFTVYLPKVAERSRSEATASDVIPTGHERILFVDDEEALAEMGQELLQELGYQVTAIGSSTQALSVVRADPSAFDLMITDQTMPGMTGVELATEILSVRADMPIILCTGFSHVVNEEQARASGIRALAMKPLTKAEIAKTVRRVLDG